MTSRRGFSSAVAADVLLAVAAVAVIAQVAWSSWGGQSGEPREPPPRRIADSLWNAARATGTEIGNPNGSIRVVEFVDLQCPGCALYHELVVDSLLTRRMERDVSFVLVHFPLRSNPQSRDAARAAECAKRQGRFSEFILEAFARQSQFALMEWHAMASSAGVSDLGAFQQCLSDPESLAPVDSGRATGDLIGIRGTPSIVVEGELFASPPSLSVILRTTKPATH